jgi:hypothetical protein
VAVALLASVSQAQVMPVTLTDTASTAKVDVGSDMGMYQWNVGGFNQLKQQWFYYRIGPSGPAAGINSIGLVGWNQNAGLNTLSTTYANSILSVSIDYTLQSKTPGRADIIENISVKNISGAPFDLHFFQYSDFDLDGNPLADVVQVFDDGAGHFDFAQQNKGMSELSETVALPSADAAEADFAAILHPKFFSPGYNLNSSNVGPVGPGDVAWAFQWDFLGVANGAQVDVFKDKMLRVTPIPEPSTLAFVSLGLAALLLRRRAL